MFSFETFRFHLVGALRDATRGYSDLYVTGVLAMPAKLLPGLTSREAVADWLHLLAGGDGTGGLVLEAKLAMDDPRSTEASRAAWRRVYELAVGLREVLRELQALEPEKASCEACEAIEGCSACDGSGLSFAESRAA